MINTKKFEHLFGFKRRVGESQIEEAHYCLALALQLVTEDVVLLMAKYAKELTGKSQLCLAGGVALNCVSNGRLYDEGIFDKIYVQPASGDAGNALGAALAAYYMHFKAVRTFTEDLDQMEWSRLGPSFSDKAIKRELSNFELNYESLEDDELISFTSKALMEGQSVAWFQGRMEFGPRALGGRSILGNPLQSETQSNLNLKVKQRESFRPFAPIMLEEEFLKYFGKSYASPYMLFVHKLLPEFQLKVSSQGNDLVNKINQQRSCLPAITHIDYSARIQTVSKISDPLMYKLLQSFKVLTGFGVLVNTSFNLRGQPIVCSPKDAIESFLSTELDILVLGNNVIRRTQNMDLLDQHIKVKLD
jgi:carbamoyltransferase